VHDQVQIAVAQVTINQRGAARPVGAQQAVAFGRHAPDVADREADVETGQSGQQRWQVGRGVTQYPQIMCVGMRTRNGGVLDDALIKHVLEEAVELRQVVFAVGASVFHQHVERVYGVQRCPQPSDPGHHEVDKTRPHHLERRYPAAEPRLGALQQCRDRLETRQSAPGGGHGKK